MNECEMALSRMIDMCLDIIDRSWLREEDREWYRNELRKFEDMIPERSENSDLSTGNGRGSDRASSGDAQVSRGLSPMAGGQEAPAPNQTRSP
jgi:hypothetical protein